MKQKQKSVTRKDVSANRRVFKPQVTEESKQVEENLRLATKKLILQRMETTERSDFEDSI